MTLGTQVLRTRYAADWQQRLASTGIPMGTLRTVGQALQTPEAKRTGDGGDGAASEGRSAQAGGLADPQ